MVFFGSIWWLVGLVSEGDLLPKKRPSKFISNNLFSRCWGIRNRHLDTGITAYLLSICCTAALEIQSVHDYNHSTPACHLLDPSTIPDHTAHRHSPSVHFWKNQDFPFPWFSRTTNNSSFVSAESSRTKFCKQKCKILISSSLCSSCAMPWSWIYFNNNNNNNNNNNSLYLNTVKTDGSCTADVAVYYNTKQYSTIQYNTIFNS